MKTFISIFTILSLAACSSTRDYQVMTDQIVDNGVQHLKDKDRGVSCYVYKDSDGVSMSCVKTTTGDK